MVEAVEPDPGAERRLLDEVARKRAVGGVRGGEERRRVGLVEGGGAGE